MWDNDGLSNDNRRRRVSSLRYPDLLDNKLGELLRQSVSIASFLKFHPTTSNSGIQPQGHFDQLLTRLIGEKVDKNLEKRIKKGEMEPSLAVLLNFLENLSATTEKFNTRWEEYPAWYLEKVLKVKPLPAVGDKVWVTFNGSGEESFTIPKNTRFKVNKEENKTAYYELVEDTTVHAIRIKELYLLEVNKKKENKEKPYPVTSLSLTELGLQDAVVTTKQRKMCRSGIRINSPVLLLREGSRAVTTTFIPRNSGWKEELKITSFNAVFQLTISTEEGWEEIETYTVTEKEGKLIVDFRLPDFFPSTAPCTYEVHQFESAYPAINFYINYDAVDSHQSSLEKFLLNQVHIKTKVEAVSNIQVYNELGKIDNSKPFSPFGIASEKGAWFTIGNYEMNVKDTKNLHINFFWEKLPENPLGMEGYYDGYGENITNDSFEISVRYLSDFQWRKVRGEYEFPLFSSEKESKKLINWSCIGPIDVEKMPVIGQEEEEYEYSLQSRHGFLNFTLTRPDMGFGETVHRRVFAEQMMKNSRRKQKYPSVLPPLQPKLKRITLDYEAEDSIDIRTGTGKGVSMIQPIVPLDNVVSRKNYQQETISFVPDQEDRNLLLALENIRPGMLVNLFFEVAPREYKDLRNNSLHLQRQELKQIRMYIGNPGNWQKMPLSFICKDETIALLISGRIQLQFPEVLSEHLYDDRGLLWLKISYDNVKDVIFPDLKAVFVNAARLEMSLPEDPADWTEINSGSGELSEDTLIPELGGITGISPFYGGRTQEGADEMLMRISEYTTHKGRAVTPRDYERLILQEFPEVAKVKCIVNKGGKRDKSIHLVVLPKNTGVFGNPLRPLTPPHLLFYIEKYVRGISSSYVQRINVINPVYEEVIIRCRIEPVGYFSVKRRKQLTERINQFIAPWRYTGELPAFGYVIDLEKMYHAIHEEFGSEIEISEFSAIRIEKEKESFVLHDFLYKKPGEGDSETIIYPTEAHSVFIPANDHIFYRKGEEIPDIFGIHEMKIGESFIVQKKK